MIGKLEYTHAFQPIVDAVAGRPVAYEALLRGPKNQTPAFIMRQLDSVGLMDFDQHSRERALALAVRLGLDCGLHLNFTPGSILASRGSYVMETIAVAEGMGIEASRLTMEITETEVIHAPHEFIEVLNQIRATGMIIAIDDFGAGHAGLNLLADIQPDMIKLDMHLIRGIQRHGARQSIVRAIRQVCLDLGIEVVAEGIETEDEFRACRKMGISLCQGYWFAKPGFECLPEVPAVLFGHDPDQRKQA